jgi:hypothetical protein
MQAGSLITSMLRIASGYPTRRPEHRNRHLRDAVRAFAQTDEVPDGRRERSNAITSINEKTGVLATENRSLHYVLNNEAPFAPVRIAISIHIRTRPPTIQQTMTIVSDLREFSCRSGCLVASGEARSVVSPLRG